MKMLGRKLIHKPKIQASFTLIEVLIAVVMLVIFVAKITDVFANAVYFSDYSRQSARAIALARAVMARIEYLHQAKDFKEFAVDDKDQVLDGFPDFTYDLSIKEWKLPVDQLLGIKAPTDGEEEDEDPAPSSEKTGAGSGGLSDILGDDLFRVAYTEVYWAEGAKRNSVSVTYLLTNQRKIDELGAQNKATFEGSYKSALSGQAQNSSQPPSGTPATSGQQPSATDKNPRNPRNPRSATQGKPTPEATDTGEGE